MNPLNGINYFLQGLSLIFKPGIRQWVLIPFLINLVLFSVLIYYAWLAFPTLIEFLDSQMQTWLPDWTWLVEIMRLLMLPLFAVFVLIVFFFVFTFIGNLIAEPFNGLLAAAVESHLTGKPVNSPNESWFKMMIGFIAEKIGKLFYYLKWAIVLILISLIPIINIISPVLWFLFGAWLAALEYSDAPLENHGYNAPARRKILAQKRILAFGFGSVVLVAMLIPIINLLVMPSAVAGATCMWVSEFADSQKNLPQS
jgi:CysZ protein